jgi:hypothetical protein
MTVNLYCGRCFFDMGVLRPLTVFRRWLEKEARFVTGGFACGFCQAERHPGDTFLRVREVSAESGEDNSTRIPHVVDGAGKVFGGG